MKTKDKLLLIIILFLGFILLNNYCFAFETSFEGLSLSGYGGSNTVDLHFYIDDSIIENYKYIYCAIFTTTSHIRGFADINLAFTNEPLTKISKYYGGAFENSFKLYTENIRYLTNDSFSINITSLDNLKDSYYTDGYYNMPSSAVPNWTPLFSNYDIYDTDSSLFFSKNLNLTGGSGPDKLNLFELNLTDLDYNNQIHKFNLSTYTNSECYDEIMEYYNNNNLYSIYITDYQRILTYREEDNDDSFQHGSYMLSGYIDFLTQDDAVFFYDKEEQKIRVGTGTYDSIIPTDKPIKRFYYKLTYSEDSNDPNVEIWTNNGNLFPSTVSQIDNSYFVGSSQTIYYASNSYKYNMYFRDFSVYYKGYLNPFEFGEKVRDISSTPFYVYNFSFGGGTTKLLFSNSSTYTEDIENIYNDTQNIYDKDEIPKDSGGGTSYIQGQGSTSSTYNEFNVTDDTTPEEDAEHEGGIRTQTTNSSEDRSDWGVLDYLKYIVDKIISIPENILKSLYNLFIPTDGQWADIKQSYINLGDLVTSKLPFVSDFKSSMEEAQNEVFASNDFLNITMPSFSYWGGETQEQQIFNVRDAYEPYRIKIRSLLALVVYGCGFVYILKTVLNYNATAAGITQSNIFNDMKKGGK